MEPRPQILLTRRWAKPVMKALNESYEVTAPAGDTPFARTEILEAQDGFEAFCPTAFDPVPADLIAALPESVRLIASFGVGIDHIDLDAAARRGLAVTNTPDVLTDDTADTAIGLMLATCRRFWEREKTLRDGLWAGPTPGGALGTKMTGKTLGIVGLGRIGHAVARRARAFDMPVVYYSRRRDPDAEVSLGLVWCETLAELLGRADIVSLHCPLTEATHHLIDRAALAAMKSTAFLVNTGRGALVDEAALVEALRDGAIAGAGLDVYEFEPRLAPGLAELENTTLLPHIGSATRETREAMAWRVKENLDAYLAGQEPKDRVV